MKTLRWLSVLAVGLVAVAAWAGEEGYLVKVVGCDRKTEWQTMSETDFKSLEKIMKLEQKFFPKAVELAGKDWRTDELNKGITFPGSRLACRSIMTAQPFPSLEKAEAQLNRLQDQEARKLEKQLEKDKKAGVKKVKTKSQDAKEAETMRAMDLVQAKLMELVGKAGGDTNAMASEIRAPLAVEEKGDAKGVKAGEKVAEKEAKGGAKKADAKDEAIKKAL